ncbi:MAG TPA: hypothetical protein DCW68_05275 [Rhodospirillaceae bacterium]|nr:MAG: hypothetical protein A2018_02375 [Alphaproteobacteria bacterium GWF2_58_20]HAU29506.1 hypothetical protein [Rhodospirillaceae bacterium]
MITVVLYALIAIGLAAAAGYAVMMFFDASQTTSQVQENQARMDTASVVVRANLRSVHQDGVLYPPYGEIPPDETMMALPSWFSVLRSAPWASLFNYCPLAPNGTYDAGGTVAKVPTGDAPTILDVTSGGGGVFEVAGDRRAQFVSGRTVEVAGSTGNDGDYVVASATYSPPPVDHTLVVVSGTVPSATPDGTLQVYYNVNTMVSAGQTYVVADNLDIPGVAASEEAGLLGLIISGPARSSQVPACSNVVYESGAFRVDGGSVRAVTSGVADAQQEFAAAGRVVRTVATSEELETALGDWASIKPRIMEIDLAPGSYTFEATTGGPLNQLMEDGDEKLLVLSGNGGIATITLTDTNADLTSGILIPSRLELDNVSLVPDASLAANGWLDIRNRAFVLRDSSLPEVRLSGANMLVSGTSSIASTTGGGLSVVGGMVQLKDGASLAVSANSGSAVSISGGLLQLLSSSTLTATSAGGGTTAHGINLIAGDVQVQDGSSLSATSATGHGVMIVGGHLQILGGGSFVATTAAASRNALYLETGRVQLGTAGVGASFTATVPGGGTAVVTTGGSFVAKGTAGSSPSIITLTRASGTLAVGMNVGGNMDLKASQVLFPNGASQGFLLSNGAMFALDEGTTVGAADPSTTQRPTIAVYDNGAMGIYGSSATVRVPSGGDCWDGPEDATGAALDTSSTCRQTSTVCSGLGGYVNACSRHLFIYSDGGVDAGGASNDSSVVMPPVYNNTTSTNRIICQLAWTTVILKNRSSWTCEVN